MINELNYYKQYIKDLLILAIPLFVGNLGHTLLGATDVLVVARYSTTSLSAVSISNSIIFTILVFGIGILVAVSILLSNLRGAKQRIKQYLPSTLVLSVIIAAIFAVICYSTKFLIPYLNLEDNIVPLIQEYISIVSLSLFGVFIFEGIKQFLQAYEIVKFPNYILIWAVIFNIIADVIFVFGFGPIPSMGSKGAAIATLIVRLTMGFLMFCFIFKLINFKNKIDLSYMKNVVKTGLPIGFALLFEFLAFNIITVLAGMEKSILAAVHSILTTIGSATFMIPLAISTALSVKVAYWFGAKRADEIKKYSYTAMYMILCFMTLISLILTLFPTQIISIFTSDKAVLDVALPLITIVAAYQIFDGFQCFTGGVLKGFKLTKTVSITVLICYWLIGAPIAYICVAKCGMSLRGYWIALAVSLCVMGFIQAAIARKYYKTMQK